MSFNRPPRIQHRLPDDEVEIPGPPATPPSPGTLNLLGLLLPLGAVMITVVLMVFLQGTNSSASSYFIFLPLMLATYVVSGLTYWLGRRNYREKLAAARTAYQASLREVEARLLALQKAQQRLLRERDPDAKECVQRAQAKSPALGERRPEDPDFLAPRLGLGTIPASIVVKGPEKNNRLDAFEAEFEHADRLSQTYAVVTDAPLAADWLKAGSVGIAGKRSEVAGVARALLAQLVTHHWPSEVQVAAIVGPKQAADWQWMYRLPHATETINWKAALAADDENPPAKLMMALETELQRREQVIEALKQSSQTGPEQGAPLPRVLFVFDSLAPDYTHPGLSLLLRKGRALGVYGLFLAQQPQLVPSQCGASIEVRGARLTYAETGVAGRAVECRADSLDVREAEALAKHLAAVAWPKSADVAQPPARLNFLEMFGAATLDDLPIATWWDRQSPYGYLRAPIGKTSSTADLVFDLNDADGAHGPHGLIGGMTGSGKSEFLKTLILALAITHHPYDINFALVDFKGGAAFNELARLPHTVGIVTDIESHATYAERVIQALAGEIEHRKRVLEDARLAFGFGRSHVDEYRLLRVKRPLPRLVLIFDEFAEFKQRQPEESKRLISIARVGRSLGVHLILATQNIQEAVDPQILQNSTFRICLKVSEPQDSIQMVGIPDAIQLSRGRAYFSAKGRKLFQSAFAGGLYGTADAPPPVATGYTRVLRNGHREALSAPNPTAAPTTDGTQGTTEAHAIIEHLRGIAEKLRLTDPPPVWPEPLPERISLPDLLRENVIGGWVGDTWQPSRLGTETPSQLGAVHPILGLYDHPLRQSRPVFQLDPHRGNGHLLVFGAAGSGKSMLLKTLGVHLARTRPPSDVHIYALDFGGQSALKVLEAFPHVGAVVSRVEAERAERLIQFMTAQVTRRNDLFRQQQVDNLRDFNERAGPGERLPTLFFLIDGFGEFKRHYSREVVDSVAGLVSGGAAAGLYLVITATVQADIPSELFSNINERLTFTQANQTEYHSIVGSPSEAKLKEDATRTPPPGRGLLRGTPPLEFQAAVPTEDQLDKNEAELLAELGGLMSMAWSGPLPASIKVLPPLVTLPKAVPDQAPELIATMLGWDYETLAPIGLALDEDGPTFLVAGATPRSGKTTLLQTWILGLMQAFAPGRVQFTILDGHSRTLGAFGQCRHVAEYVGSKTGLEAAVSRLAAEVRGRADRLEDTYEADRTGAASRAYLASIPHLVVVIDDYDIFAARVQNERLQLGSLLTLGDDLGLSFILAGNAAELPRDHEDPLIRRARRQGCGVLLGGSSGIENFNSARAPAPQGGIHLTAGRGYLVRRGQVRLFQAAAYWYANENPSNALAERIKTCGPEAT